MMVAGIKVSAVFEGLFGGTDGRDSRALTAVARRCAVADALVIGGGVEYAVWEGGMSCSGMGEIGSIWTIKVIFSSGDSL